MIWLQKLAAGSLIAAVAFVAGSVAASHEPRSTISHQVVIVKTKSVPGPTRTVQKNVLPSVCQQALDRTKALNISTSKYEADLGGLSKLLDDAYRMITDKDLDGQRNLKQQEIFLESSSIQDLLDIRSAQYDLKTLLPKCEAAVG